MKMQDKELDELFRSNLDDLEFTPSPGVWAGIDAELEKGRRKKIYVPFLSIAASIIVLFTIGYLIIPKKTGTNGKNAQVVLVPPPVKESVLTAPDNKVFPAKVKPGIIKTYAGNKPQQAYATESGDTTNKVIPVQTNSDEQLTAVNTNQTAILTPVLPDENFRIAPQPFQIKPTQTVEPQQTIAQVPAINDKRPTVKPKHAALSLGSLINAMVAKVDKRQDKIIEFTDDDGDSNITGVNLGIIKIKKDQQSSEK